MSLLSITNVDVINSKANFNDNFQFKISFNCMEELPGVLEWNLIYVGSSDCSKYDQTIDSVEVGPIPPGNHEFNFDTESSVDPKRIQDGHLLGPTVIILNAAYNNQEFVRVGYYINIGYDPETHPEFIENPPAKVDYSLLRREILHSEPRVTRFKINWTNTGDRYSVADGAMEQSQNIAQGMSAESLMMGVQDENIPPNAEMFKNAAQGTILGNRVEALLCGMNENSNGPGAFGSSSFKAGYGNETYETSMNGNL